MDMPENTEESTITYVVDAPRDVVWKAWTDSRQLAQWLAPKGMTTISCTVDLRLGGLCHHGMTTPDGQESWAKFVYREIIPPEKLMYVVSLSDPQGETVRHFTRAWPLEVLDTTTFSEQDGKTTITSRSIPINATDHEREVFEANREPMRQMSYEMLLQLDEYLKNVKS